MVSVVSVYGRHQSLRYKPSSRGFYTSGTILYLYVFMFVYNYIRACVSSVRPENVRDSSVSGEFSCERRRNEECPSMENVHIERLQIRQWSEVK